MDFLAKRNISLDFFRGIMALFVCLGHFFYWNRAFIIPSSFILAVDFFLVLSGFVLCHSVYTKKDRFNSIHFALKRYWRFFPVYITCVLLAFLCMFLSAHRDIPTLFDIFRIVTLAQMLPFNPRSDFYAFEPIKIAYTISAELWVGILVFPLLVTLLEKCRVLLFPFFMILIIGCLIILNNASMGFPDSYGLYNSFITYGIIRCLFEYAIGIVTYLVLIQIKTLPRKHFNSLIQLAVLILFILIYGKFDYNKNNDFLAPFFFAVLIFSLSCKNGILYTLTANRLGKFLGNISYSVYLLHPIWVAFMTKYYHMPVTTLPMILIYFSEVVFSAYLLHRFVEKPCLKGLNFSATLKE